MQFNVPQFEIEDKLFGPFTVVQFLYISIALAISFFLFPVFATWLWLIISAILVGGSLMIALVKIGGRPMLVFLLAAAYYLWEPKTLIIPKPVKAVELKQSLPAIFVKKTTAPSVAAPAEDRSVVSESKTTELKQSLPAIFVKKTTAPSVAAPAEDRSVVSKQDNYIDASVTPTIKEPAPPSMLEDEKGQNDSSLRNLFNKMLTYSSPIPFREAGFNQASSNEKKEYESMQKPTGETIVAQRIDYR